MPARPAPARTHRPGIGSRLLAAACVTLGLVASTLGGDPASASPTAASVGCSSTSASGPSRVGGISGIVRPQHTGSGCAAAPVAGLEAPYFSGANPPLLNHGGPMMSTQATGDRVVVTPIFWEPSGSSMTSSYKTTITTYLNDLAADSGRLTNVFASLFQYGGSNGGITYAMTVGTPIDDTTAFPGAGCTPTAGQIYADLSGYTTCLDDAQVNAEASAVVTSHSLPKDLGHLYVMFLPQHVESCINPGATTTSANFCTINSTPSTAYCAYHSITGTVPAPLVYANMPFPIYSSPAGSSCTAEDLGGGIQAPNAEPDADVEISPLSHEMAEAITDPDTQHGWFDASGNENGDDCAYIYGALSGAAGAHYNQTINGHHYLTQEEFSNQDFVPGVSGCVQGMAAATPTVTGLSSTSGPAGGGGALTITGSGFPGASSVHFGVTSASFTVLDATHVSATIPAGIGPVDVTVTTSAGTSATTAADRYTYPTPAPTVTGVSPASGSTAGGQHVTITGTGFAAGATVTVGGQAATSVQVDSGTQITATTPAHPAGVADVVVTTIGGSSVTSAADRYTYVTPVSPPTVTGLSPASGPTSGGRRVTVTGTGFAAGATVSFGAAAGSAVTVVSPTTITVTTPKHAKGTVDVRVTTAGGASVVSAGDRYTFLVRPAVTRISRTSGTRRGGTRVTITGSGFTPASTVLFGTRTGRKVTVLSPTRITVVSPRHSAGRVDVRVRTPGGTSPTSRVDRYTFT